MRKLYKIALEAKGFKNVEAILEVCEATPNAQVAIEMLVGVYEEPIINNTYTDHQKRVWTKNDYEQIREEVFASCSTNKKQIVHFDNRISNVDDIKEKYAKTESVPKEFDPGYNTPEKKFQDYFYLEINEMETLKKSFDLNQWQKN